MLGKKRVHDTDQPKNNDTKKGEYKMIELMKYSLRNEVDGQIDKNLIDELMDETSEERYISDAISEIAESNISVYTSDVLNAAKGVYYSGAYEDASNEGFMGESNDLIANIQSAWYFYNSQVLGENLDEIIFNYGAEYFNNNFNDTGFDKEAIERVDEEYRYELGGVDSGSTFREISDIIDTIVENIVDESEESETVLKS